MAYWQEPINSLVMETEKRQSAYYDLINKDIHFKERFSREEMIHYGFMDLFWQIDIISFTPPIVKKISVSKGISLE